MKKKKTIKLQQTRIHTAEWQLSSNLIGDKNSIVVCVNKP